MRWLGIQLMRYHHIICDLLYIAWNLTKSRGVCFFSGSITSNITQIHYASEGKVKGKLQYVPENYLSPFLAARVSEESRWELKCRENRLVTAFKTRQKFHFRDIPFTKLKSHTLQQHLWQPHFRATIGQIPWRLGMEFFFKGQVVRRKSSCLFSNWAPASCGQEAGEGNCEKEDSLFTISDMFLDKERLSKQVTFSTLEKWSLPS